jgi:hypothetical protein
LNEIGKARGTEIPFLRAIIIVDLICLKSLCPFNPQIIFTKLEFFVFFFLFNDTVLGGFLR